MQSRAYEEGDTCPECNEGKLKYGPVENCTCHINPPCSACVDNPLVCNSCGAELDPYEQREGKTINDIQKQALSALHRIFGANWIGKNRTGGIVNAEKKPVNDIFWGVWRNDDGTYCAEIPKDKAGLIELVGGEDPEPFDIQKAIKGFIEEGIQ